MQEGTSYLSSGGNCLLLSPMDAVRKLILEKVDERGTNLSELSRKIGRNHAYLQQFIHRGSPVRLPEQERGLIAQQLGVEENLLKLSGSASSTNGTANHDSLLQKSNVAERNRGPIVSGSGQHASSVITEGAALAGERDLPVFGTAQGGKGAVVLSNDAVDYVSRPTSLLRVKDGYGVIVTGESMSPEHKPGSTALVNPNLPPRSGDTCIFRNHADDGSVLMCIKELVRQTDNLWYVKQHNPKKSFTLKKAEWQVCHVTVGNYFRM